jgi:mono/diheme cytochrome c family protein
VSGHIVDVKVPQLSSVEQEGKTLFDANCAVCHGVSAGGSNKGPPLVHIYYEPDHHGDEAFYFGVQHGVRQHHWRFGNMPPVAGVSEADVTRIITYVRALQSNNGIH